MQWNERYEINVASLDDQHKEWFAKVAKFKAAINQEHMVAEIARTLKFVVDYSQKHIADEETYMREINYPHIDHQIELHQAFMQKIVSVLTDLKNGKRIIPSQLHDFMVSWISQHILEHDMKIGEYLTAQETDSPGDAPPPTEEQGNPVLSKLKELASFLKSELITPEDYTEKSRELLTQFVSETSTNNGNSILEKYDRLVELQSQGLISEESVDVAKELLSKDIDIDQVLEPYDTPKTKMHTLKTLHKNSLITDAAFDEYKAMILSSI